jgi:catechol 2,3-dioxygenase-like lactoylglutathione lyase family enzyme
VFDHVQIAVSDLDASARFYRIVLSVLGAEPVRADEDLVGPRPVYGPTTTAASCSTPTATASRRLSATRSPG